MYVWVQNRAVRSDCPPSLSLWPHLLAMKLKNTTCLSAQHCSVSGRWATGFPCLSLCVFFCLSIRNHIINHKKEIIINRLLKKIISTLDSVLESTWFKMAAKAEKTQQAQILKQNKYVALTGSCLQLIPWHRLIAQEFIYFRCQFTLLAKYPVNHSTNFNENSHSVNPKLISF